MITIKLTKNKESQITAFTISGHAGYSEHGTDIVCAAVTVAAMTAVNGLTDVVGLKIMPEVSEGFLSCNLPDNLSEKERHDADILLDSMICSN